MSGEYKGVAARLTADNPKAFHIHCNACVFNLVDAVEAVVPARNTLSTVGQLQNFILASAEACCV